MDYNIYDFGNEENIIFIRFKFNKSNLSNGTLTLLQGVNNSSVNKFNLFYDSTNSIFTYNIGIINIVSAFIDDGWHIIEIKASNTDCILYIVGVVVAF